jgi:protoheme IX farnesyltransferase
MNPEEIVVPSAVAPAVPLESVSWIGDMMALTKARLTTLVLLTTSVGFCMGSEGPVDWFALFRVLFGTAFVAAAASVLNQFIERDADRLMHRTKDRPLPTGRMQPLTALGLGTLLGVAGTIYLFKRVNTHAAWLALATLAVYLLFYTPLKRRTSLCVTVGAISGAIPPMIGWAAAKPSLGTGAWILFGVMFLWQMPHFMAIAWMYRDEYAQAGFVMLRRNDVGGRHTSLVSLLYTVGLSAVTLMPFFLKMTSVFYLVGAILLNAAMLWCAFQFLLRRDRPSARKLFFASIIYLPIILGLLVLTKT